MVAINGGGSGNLQEAPVRVEVRDDGTWLRAWLVTADGRRLIKLSSLRSAAAVNAPEAFGLWKRALAATATAFVESLGMKVVGCKEVPVPPSDG